MPEYYGDINRVKIDSGIRLEDLYFEDDEDLETGQTAEEKFQNYLEDTMIKAKSYIDYHRNKEFVDPVPELVNSIAERIAINMLSIAVRDQSNEIVEIGDFNVELIETKVLTPGIKDDLRLLPTGSDKSNKGKLNLGIVGDIEWYEDEEPNKYL